MARWKLDLKFRIPEWPELDVLLWELSIVVVVVLLGNQAGWYCDMIVEGLGVDVTT